MFDLEQKYSRCTAACLMARDRNRVERFFIVYRVYRLLVTPPVASCTTAESFGVHTDTHVDWIKLPERISRIPRRESDYSASEVNYDNGTWVR